MKKQILNNSRKLSLKKVVLSSLNNESMAAVQGGATQLGCAQPTTTVQHSRVVCATIGVTCIDCNPTLSGCQSLNICDQ